MNRSSRSASLVARVIGCAIVAAGLAVGAGLPAQAAPTDPDPAPSTTVLRPQGVDAKGAALQPAEARAAVAAADVGPPITRQTILARAKTWLDARVPYSQTTFRDGYRTDCSGYVSMAWATNRNYWTGDLHTIGVRLSSYNQLRPGDMLLYHNPANPVNGSHVVLFDRWTGAVGGDFYIYEQTPPRTTYRKWSEAGYSRSLYIPYRYVNVIEDGAGDGTFAPAFGTSTEQHYFGAGSDGHLHHWYWTPATGVGYQDWGGSYVGKVVALATPTQQIVFGRGPDGHLRQTWWDINNPSVYTQVDWTVQAGGPTLAGDPAAFEAGGVHHVFAAGTDGKLHHWFWSPTEGFGHQNWGGSYVGDVYAFGTASLQMVFGRGPDGHLKQTYWHLGNPGEYTQVDWTNEAGGPTLAGDPAAFEAGGVHHVFAAGTDGKLHHWYWSSEGFGHQNWGGDLAG